MGRRSAGLIVAVIATTVLVVGGTAVAERSVTSVKGNIHAEFNAAFAPKTLSKTRPAPISFVASASLKTLNGDHIPPLREFVLEGDRNTGISVKGVPVCDPRIRSQSLTSREARELCGESLIGVGHMEVEIEFTGTPPSQPPVPAKSNMLAFNGGFKGGVTTFYLHAYITGPTPAAIVTVVRIKRVNKGRFGWQAVAKIPKIAGGNGSVSSFNLKLGKKGILFAKCPDGRLKARTTAVFSTTPPTKLSAPVTRPCTGI